MNAPLPARHTELKGQRCLQTKHTQRETPPTHLPRSLARSTPHARAIHHPLPHVSIKSTAWATWTRASPRELCSPRFSHGRDTTSHDMHGCMGPRRHRVASRGAAHPSRSAGRIQCMCHGSCSRRGLRYCYIARLHSSRTSRARRPLRPLRHLTCRLGNRCRSRRAGHQ